MAKTATCINVNNDDNNHHHNSNKKKKQQQQQQKPGASDAGCLDSIFATLHVIVASVIFRFYSWVSRGFTGFRLIFISNSYGKTKTTTLLRYLQVFIKKSAYFFHCQMPLSLGTLCVLGL